MLRLGCLELATNLLLAPIAGYCDLAFRTVCREWGGVGLACTDLLSPQGLLRGTATSLDLAKTNDFDKPVGMQLYGSDPEIMAQGARWAVEHGATLVDINMGCPVDKVTKKDGGSKLLTDLARAVAVAARVVRELERCPVSADEWKKRQGTGLQAAGSRHEASGIGDSAFGEGVASGAHAAGVRANGVRAQDARADDASAAERGPVVVPLTCKMRLCWSTADYEAGQACSPHLARMLADVGVVGVTVHGRTTEMKFGGQAQLPGIARVVEAVNGRIPVIGNGDVRRGADAARMIRETGCQGVMIGRGALSAPWVFREAWAAVRGVEPPPEPTEAQKLATIRRFFDLMREHRDDRYAMFQINRRVSWFAKTLQRDLGSGKMESIKPFKEAMRHAATPAEVYDALDRFAAGELRSGVADAAEIEA
ncbi:MAG: tRNA-dihydrouridine synthase [Planctomycetota bacterium]|nr:tRNA-dihydrouridine synthase [Planctomycetota bacterium]